MTTTIYIHPQGELEVTHFAYREEDNLGRCCLSIIADGLIFGIHHLNADAIEKLGYKIIDMAQRQKDVEGRLALLAAKPGLMANGEPPPF